MQSLGARCEADTVFYQFPSPDSVALEANTHLAPPRRIPPHIVVENGKLRNRGMWYMRTSLKALRYPLVIDPPTDQKTISKLINRNRRVSFMADGRSTELEHALEEKKAHRKFQIQFLQRLIGQEDYFAPPATRLKIVDLSQLEGDKLYKGWTDFVQVYGFTRLFGNAKRKGDPASVVRERLRHIMDRGLKTDRAHVLVAYLGRIPVGTASLYRMDEDDGSLPRLQFADASVYPSFQNHKVGTIMTEYRLSLARRMGAPFLAYSTMYDPENYSARYLAKYGFQHWFNVDYYRIPKVA